MKLIRAKNKDIEILLEIEKTAAGLKVYSGYFNEKEIGEWIKNESVYLIENDSFIVGSISYEIKSKEHVLISGLVIKPEYQKRGYARTAMLLLMEKIRNFKKLTLEVHPDNHAIKLYESLGFAELSREDNYFGDGEPRLIMVRR